MTRVASPGRPHQAYAGLVSRLAALAIDVALISATTIAIRLLPEVAWEQVVNRPAPGWIIWIAGTAALVLPWAYFSISWWLTGQTVGDLLLGVVVLRRDGQEMSLPHAALRAVAGLGLAPVWLVGLLAVLWDGDRRALHDRVFRTIVRYTTKSSASTSPQP